jgi:hypothetical protein
MKNRIHIIRSNYGDDSIALTQWAFEASLTQVFVVYIDTGWSSVCWEERVKRGEMHAKHLGYQVVRLKAPISFNDAVLGRKSFPTAKFAWCAGILKGLPFLDWVDQLEIEMNSEALVLLAKRKSAVKTIENSVNIQIQEWINSSEHYNDRTVWHPLINIEEAERNALLSRAGFSPLNHRSLECHPCVFSTPKEIAHLQEGDIQKLKALETELQMSFLESNELKKSEPETEHYLEPFYRGCGNHFGCGL